MPPMFGGTASQHHPWMKSRYPAIRKDADGKMLCRGCGGDVPKGRQTWCSRICYDTHCPQQVILKVKQRDLGICQLCAAQTLGAPNGHLRRILKMDWLDIRRTLPKAHFDHVVPFSEGGPTTLENLRTLCIPCHKERTKQWHKERVKR